MDPLIRARGLVKRYGGRTVVKGIDLDIHPNEVVALIGPNGAGKTTTLEMILGLRPPDGGSVAYWCEDPRKHLGVQLQATPFFPAFTAAENLQLIATFYGMRLQPGEMRDILQRCWLAEEERTETSRLSGGQQKRLAISGGGIAGIPAATVRGREFGGAVPRIDCLACVQRVKGMNTALRIL